MAYVIDQNNDNIISHISKAVHIYYLRECQYTYYNFVSIDKWNENSIFSF